MTAERRQFVQSQGLVTNYGEGGGVQNERRGI